jgi:hypothetical protein
MLVQKKARLNMSLLQVDKSENIESDSCSAAGSSSERTGGISGQISKMVSQRKKNIIIIN